MLKHLEGSRSNMPFLLRPALLAFTVGLTSLFCLIQSSTTASTASTNLQEGQGLSGILPPEPPEGLWEDDFLVLGDTWEEWSVGAAEDVMSLFTEQDTTVEEQRAALAAVKNRLKVMEIALGDEAYELIHPPLARIYGKLKPRHDLAEAMLTTLAMDPAQEKKDKLSEAQTGIRNHLNETIEYLNKYDGGSAWIEYLDLADAASAVESATGPKQVLSAVNPIVRKINRRTQLKDEAQQKFLGREAFVELVDSVKMYRAVNNRNIDPQSAKNLRADFSALVTALEQYSETVSSADAKAVTSALASVKQHAPDGGAAIDSVMRAHYFNFNFHFVAHEDFLDRVIRERRVDRGPVRDFVLGANVSGNQTTNSSVGIDLKPSDEGIRFNLVLNGTVRSNTAGRTSQATVFTTGTHYFTARKGIFFDGDQFSTEPATIGVNANNRTYGARTQLEGIPILQGIARNIAKNEAARKRPQSEAIARYKVANRVKPEFDSEVDKQFAEATESFQKDFFKSLRSKDLYPSARTLKSSESHLLIDTRTMGAGELGGSRPLNIEYTGPGACIDFHESAVNNTFARMDIGGKTMTDKELAEYMRKFINEAFNLQFGETAETKPSYDDAEGDPTAFVIAQHDPIRIRFQENQAILILKAGLKQEGEDDIPTQEISVPITFTLEGSQIILESGDAGVSPVERPESFQVQIARAGIMRKKIGDAVGRQEFDSDLKLNEDNEDPDDDKIVTIREISFLNGWARVVIE